MNVWQVSGGPSDRSYTDVFLQHGVALIGPGDPGPWSPERYGYDFRLKGLMERFAEGVQPGDVVVLRSGTSSIQAVGLVANDYLYLNQFDDVNGWDLQHTRRVRWGRLPSEHRFGTPVFGANPSRFSRVRSAEIREYVRRYLNSPPTHWQTASLPPLPDEEPFLGNIPEALRHLVATAHDLYPLYWNREDFGDHPSEHEIVAHFVVPFLRALGWPPELIAIEWSKKGRKKIDVAVFNKLPRSPGNCCFIVEAKYLGAGVEGAVEQARGYLDVLGVQRDIVVTDGIRYRMYSCETDYGSAAYANLARLKRSATELFSRLGRP